MRKAPLVHNGSAADLARKADLIAIFFASLLVQTPAEHKSEDRKPCGSINDRARSGQTIN